MSYKTKSELNLFSNLFKSILLPGLMLLAIPVSLQAQQLEHYNEQTKTLNLSYGNLTTVNKNILAYSNLENLVLTGNNISRLPDFLTQFKNLRSLDISGNKNLDIDSAITILGKINTLETLDISNCNLYYLPVSIKSLYRLKTLNVSRNNIEHLPNEIKSILQLERLNIAGNQLIEIPASLYYLESLHRLDISANPFDYVSEVFEILGNLSALNTLMARNMTGIPNEAGKLKSLKYLDISYSDLSKLSSQLSRLDSLQTLVVQNCTNVDYTKLFGYAGGMENLQTLQIEDNTISQLPNGIGQLSELTTLSISGYKLEFLSKDINRLLRLKTLSLTFAQHINTEELFRSIYQIESLENIEIKNCMLGFIPTNVEELTHLKNLDLRGNNLTSLPYAVTSLGLRRINISGNPFDPLTVADLRKQMPRCQVIFDKENTVHPPIEFPQPTISNFNFIGGEPFSATLSTGMNIHISETAIIDRDGNPVRDSVRMQIRHYDNPLSIPGLMKDGLHFPFELVQNSLFEIKLFRNDEPLEISPRADIEAYIAAPDSANGISTYYLMDTGKNWDKIQPAFYEVNQSNTHLESHRVSPAYNIPTIEYEMVYFKFLTPFTSRTFKFKLNGSESSLLKRFSKNKSPYLKTFPELAQLKKLTFKYDGLNARQDFRNFKSLVKKTVRYEKYKILNLRLDPNPAGDNYMLRFMYKNDTIGIPVFVDFRTKNHVRIQEKNKLIYEKYQDQLLTRLYSWNEIDENYKQLNLNYQQELQGYRNWVDSFNTPASGNYFLRINQQGYGCLARPHTGLPLQVNIVADDENQNEPEFIMLLHVKDHTVGIYRPTDEIFLEAGSDYRLFALYGNNRIGFAGKEELNKAMLQNGDEKIIAVKIHKINPVQFPNFIKHLPDEEQP